MKEAKVRQYLAQDYPEFIEWMKGQTVGINPDGSLDYYDYDVRRFFESKLNKLKLEEKR